MHRVKAMPCSHGEEVFEDGSDARYPQPADGIGIITTTGVRART
jgi:hypothetical protein